MTEIGVRIMPYPAPQEHPADKEGSPTVSLRFEHPVFHPMICYFKVLFACATSRATINVPPDPCYERFWHRLFG
jgi:hypothetical protein